VKSLISNHSSFDAQLLAANGNRRVGIIAMDRAEAAAARLLASPHDASLLWNDHLTSVQSVPPVSTAVIMMRSGSMLAAHAVRHRRYRPWFQPALSPFPGKSEILAHFPRPYLACETELAGLLAGPSAVVLLPMTVALNLV
jgi:hypothetical protein